MLSFELDCIFLPRLVSTNTELRVEVRSLSGQDRIVIEIGRLVLEMPFPDHGGLVSCFAEFNGKGLLAWRDAPGEIECVVIMIILSRENAGARGRTDGIGAEGIFKKGPFFGEPVDGGGWSHFCEATAVSGYSMGRMIIRHNEENVGTGVVAAVMIGQSKGRQEGEEREKLRSHLW